MKDFTIAIYCLIDDLLLRMNPNPTDKRRKLTDAQVITTAILAAKYFYGNQASACGYLRDHHGFTIPDKSNFNRILHRLTDVIASLFLELGLIFKHLNISKTYIIDSFPVIVCKNIRISRSKLVKGDTYRGYNASKREYFFGFKVHLIATADGIPVEFMVTAGSVHDNTAFQGMAIDLPAESDLYADSAYLNQDQKELLAVLDGIRLKAATRKNCKVRDTWAEELENKYYRKRIENTFADITAKFPKKLHAVTASGFLLKILCFIVMFILDKQF
jgi:Transposase DDE domain